MEIRNYYLLVKKHWVTLICIPLMVVIVTFFLFRGKSNIYQSKVQIATGIVDQSQRVLNSTEGYVPDSKITEEFTNLTETIKLNKVVDQVSFLLFIHDMTDPSPFNPLVKKYVHLSGYSKNIISNLLRQKVNRFETLNLNLPVEKNLDSLLTKIGYDRESLQKNILVYRIESSDFIAIDVDAQTPEMSAFIANNLTERFIAYYSSYLNSGHNRSNEFFTKLLVEKRNALNKKTSALESFKIKNGILDIADESKDLYTQLNDLESHQQQADKDVIAYTGALKSIDAKFDPKDRAYLEATTSKINAKILSTRENLKALNDSYIKSEFNPRFKKNIDSLQKALGAQIDESSDKYISNPMVSRDNLVQEKLKMQNELELARYSSASLQGQLSTLKSKLGNLVPAQAMVKSYERDIDIATKEYLDIQDKYNQAGVSSIAPVQLHQLELAMPGKIKSSKKILIVGVSGITTFIVYLVVLLLIFYLDDNIRTSEDLERITGIRILGHLNIVPNMLYHLNKKHKEENAKNDMRIYRNLLRAIRFEIDMDMDGGKVLAITSLNKGEGKTLFAFSLAYAYSLANKNVLLIDGNFTNPVISETVKSKDYLEDFFSSESLIEPLNDENISNQRVADGGELRLLEINNATSIGETIQRLSSHERNGYGRKESISILGNKGGDISILEISNEAHIKLKIDKLKTAYDIIIIEAGSLNTLNKSKEWMVFADKFLAVFESNQGLNRTHLPAVNYLRSLNGKMLGWVINKMAIDSSEAI